MQGRGTAHLCHGVIIVHHQAVTFQLQVCLRTGGSIFRRCCVVVEVSNEPDFVLPDLPEQVTVLHLLAHDGQSKSWLVQVVSRA